MLQELLGRMSNFNDKRDNPQIVCVSKTRIYEAGRKLNEFEPTCGGLYCPEVFETVEYAVPGNWGRPTKYTYFAKIHILGAVIK